MNGIAAKERILKPSVEEIIIIPKDVPMRNYFKWMNSVIAVHNQNRTYLIDEYILIQNNFWILDTLVHTDYYYKMEKKLFNEDSQVLIALHKGQTLTVPDSLQSEKINDRLGNTFIGINIPEFRLRIVENRKEIYQLPFVKGRMENAI